MNKAKRRFSVPGVRKAKVRQSRAASVMPVLLVILLLSLISACASSVSSGTSGPQPGDSGGTSTGGSNGSNAGNSGSGVVSNPGGGLPTDANKPQPPLNVFQGCPSGGDGGDPQLNMRKNRTDSAPWYPVAIASILSLSWPKGIERQPRNTWSSSNAAEIARYEGIPIQVEGWLAGAKQQGPESCNCHSVNDVDNHLWIVDSPNKNRSQSLVIEVTPRVRATHPGWAFERLQPLVDGRTKVRISGWLMMDQEHPDQIGKTRGTIWEIHPIIAFDVQRGGTWVTLDTGRVSTTESSGAEAAPTEDPNLPPPIVDPLQGSNIPTPTPRPLSKQSGGRSTSTGTVQIDDIFYNGVKGSNEPDEYVEIANLGQQPVNMDGWVLRDIYGSKSQEFTWHGFTFDGQHKIRVYTNETHQESGGFSFQSSNAIWSNKGDAAELLDASGNVVSTFAYGDKK